MRYKSLQQFFKHCVEEDELEVSPMTGMRAPNVEERPVPVVSDDILTKLAQGPIRHRHSGIVGTRLSSASS